MKKEKITLKCVFENIIVTAVFLFALWVCGWILYEGVSETNKNREYVGREIVVGNDTLTIVDYQTSYGYFILDNGTLMDKSYARTNTLKIRPNKAQIDSVFVDDCLIEKEKESN